MRIIPLSATPSQTLLVDLASQQCQIDIYQKLTGVYCDFRINNSTAATVAGRICLDRTLIVREDYLGFSGDIAFVDQRGESDPDYTGFGSRFLLYYFEKSDLQA
jgi:hypothetical protein